MTLSTAFAWPLLARLDPQLFLFRIEKGDLPMQEGKSPYSPMRPSARADKRAPALQNQRLTV